MFESILFYISAGMLLVTYAGVVLARNAVYSAIWLVISLVLTALCFGIIGIPFLAVTQLLVYAGGVMVLFLFIIMMASSRSDEIKVKTPLVRKFFIVICLLFPVVALYITLFRSSGYHKGLSVITNVSTGSIVEALFHKYLIPFELASIILLTAALGSVLLLGTEKK